MVTGTNQENRHHYYMENIATKLINCGNIVEKWHHDAADHILEECFIKFWKD